MIEVKELDKLIDRFMNRLEQNNQIIVNRTDYAAADELKKLQTKLLKKSAVTPYELAKSQLLPYTTIQGILKSKKWHPGELYKTSSGKWMVTTCAIKRLRSKIYNV
jgi:predicted transcriptional regulator